MIFERNLKLRKNKARIKNLYTQHLEGKYFTKKPSARALYWNKCVQSFIIIFVNRHTDNMNVIFTRKIKKNIVKMWYKNEWFVVKFNITKVVPYNIVYSIRWPKKKYFRHYITIRLKTFAIQKCFINNNFF